MIISILNTQRLTKSLILLFIYQLLGAFALYFLTRIFKDIARGVAPTLSSIGFFLFTVLPYFIWCFSRKELIHAANESYKNLLDVYVKKNEGQTLQWSDEYLKTKRSSLLSKEAYDLIRQMLVYIFDAFSLLLNFILGIGMIAYVSDSLIIVAYAISIFAMLFALKPWRSRITSLSIDLQKKQVAFDAHVWSLWDNLMIGNKLNLNNWKKRQDDNYRNLDNAESQQVFLQEYSTALASFSAMTVVCGVNAYLFFKNTNNLAAIGMLAVTLPKQVSFVNNFKVISYYLTSYTSLLARFSELENVIEPIPEYDFQNRIDFSKISITNSDKTNLDITELKSAVFSIENKKGRFTVAGANGCGKSTFLKLLKKEFGEAAYYLPAKHNLDFNNLDKNQSTGEALLSQLQELVKQNNLKILLLDEWDANLDSNNKNKISNLLNSMTETVTIVEVSHRNFI